MISHRAAALGLLGAAVLAAPAVAGNRRGDTGTPYGDWKVFCPEEGQSCVAVQSVINAAGDDVVLMVSREPPGDTAVLSVATPPGIAIGRGLTLVVGNRQATLRRGLTCYETNCAIQVGLDAQTLAMLRRGAPVSVLYYSSSTPQKPVRFRLSLNGFSQAFAALPAQSR